MLKLGYKGEKGGGSLCLTQFALPGPGCPPRTAIA